MDFVREWLAGSLPQSQWWCSVIAAACAVGGVFFWILGARFSQPIVTLALVATGAFVGLRLPRWYALPLGSWATAIGGALILGTLGYLLHRIFVGAALTLLLTVCAAFALLLQNDAAMASLPRGWDGDVTQMARGTWDALSLNLQRVGLTTCGTAIVTGLGLAVIFPRFSTYLFYSLLGFILVLLAIPIGRPQLSETLLPAAPMTQLLVTFGLIVAGTLIQWRTSDAAPSTTP